MIFFAVILALKWVAFIGACVLTIAAFVVTGLGREQSRRSLLFTLMAAIALVTALCYIPRLDYYIEYGIQTQAVSSTRMIEFCLAISLLASLFVAGGSKWISIAAIICGYLAFAIA